MHIQCKEPSSFQPTPVTSAATTSTPTTSILLLLLLISDNNNSKPLFFSNSKPLKHLIHTRCYTKSLTSVKSFNPHKNFLRKKANIKDDIIESDSYDSENSPNVNFTNNF